MLRRKFTGLLSHSLGHGSKGSEEVFHRQTIAHQRKVIMKASAYVEVIISDTCKYRVQGDRGTRASNSKNPVQAYLSGLTVQQVRELHGDVQAATRHEQDDESGGHEQDDEFVLHPRT